MSPLTLPFENASLIDELFANAPVDKIAAAIVLIYIFFSCVVLVLKYLF